MLKIIFKPLFNFLYLIRYWDWQDKIWLNTAAVLLLLLFTNSFHNRIKDLIIYTMYMSILLSYGYLINSFADREKDLKIGKNHFKHFSKNFILTLVILLGCLTLIIPFYWRNIYILIIVIVGFFFATFYSLKPIRYKEKGMSGIIVATITQRLPFLLFLILMPANFILILYLFGWLLIVGLLIEMAHQMVDYKNDKFTKTNTYVGRVGIEKIINIIYYTGIILILYLMLPMISMSIQGVALSILLMITASYSLHPVCHAVTSINTKISNNLY